MVKSCGKAAGFFFLLKTLVAASSSEPWSLHQKIGYVLAKIDPKN